MLPLQKLQTEHTEDFTEVAEEEQREPVATQEIIEAEMEPTEQSELYGDLIERFQIQTQ